MGPAMNTSELVYWLSPDSDKNELFSRADAVRRQFMGEGVLLRGIVEFSNYCDKTCQYCGLQQSNTGLKRFRMTREEIIESVAEVAAHQIKTVVLQSGEDPALDPKWLAEIISLITTRFDLAITLSVGERPSKDYELWKKAGADRYLLKIETTNPALYETIHPGMSLENRLRCLRELKELGYQTGSGMIIGLPGQTLVDIAHDIEYFRDENFDMIGIGPFIPHPETSLANQPAGDPELTIRAIALTRLETKNTNLPGTTALGSLGKDYRLDALKAGANVLMPNFTANGYKNLYDLYPNRRCVNEQRGECVGCMERKVASVGRTVDFSRGDRNV